MKDIYKNYLKIINKSSSSDLYEEISSLCYKLNYKELSSSVDTNLFPALLEYSKGDNGKFYTSIKKWIRGINTEKKLLQLYNVCNLGMRKSLQLDIEDDSISHNPRFSNNNLLAEYRIIEHTISEDFTFKNALKDSKELSAIISLVKSADVNYFIKPHMENDKEKFISKLTETINSSLNDEEIRVNQLAKVDSYYNIYNSLVESMGEVPDELVDAIEYVFKCDKYFMAFNTVDEMTDNDIHYLISKVTSNVMRLRGGIKGGRNNSTITRIIETIMRDYKIFLTMWSNSYLEVKINPKEILQKILRNEEYTNNDLRLLLKYFRFTVESSPKIEYRSSFKLFIQYINYMQDSINKDKDTNIENIHITNSDLFNLCLAIKLCLLNNSKVFINDFNTKVDERKMINYLRTNLNIAYKQLTGKEYRYDGPDYGIPEPIINYMKTGDVAEFEKSGKDALGTYWINSYVNYYFSNLQDNNIGGYVNFLSSSLYIDCLGPLATQSAIPFSLVYEDEFKSIYNRKFIIPNKGIIAEILGGSFYMREFDNILDEHCISIIYKSGEDYKEYGYLLINLSARTITGLNVGDLIISIIKATLECKLDDKVKCLHVNLEDIKNSYVELEIDNIPNEVKEAKPEIISPYYWKYRGDYNGTSELAEHSPMNSSREIVVNAFVRRLPNGGVASKERQDLARRYCINLENGYTIVDSFVRKSTEGCNRYSNDG